MKDMQGGNCDGGEEYGFVTTGGELANDYLQWRIISAIEKRRLVDLLCHNAIPVERMLEEANSTFKGFESDAIWKTKEMIYDLLNFIRCENGQQVERRLILQVEQHEGEQGGGFSLGIIASDGVQDEGIDKEVGVVGWGEEGLVVDVGGVGG
ncbi:hypothetical protein BDZ91DRAFT_768623 [Kalaharituber pfeilii]|nr:hypothetical protein BDZ91DRAFT_768623 [Kalaharituber pfeilii]